MQVAALLAALSDGLAPVIIAVIVAAFSDVSAALLFACVTPDSHAECYSPNACTETDLLHQNVAACLISYVHIIFMRQSIQSECRNPCILYSCICCYMYFLL